jgi:phage repressor protein C with HTH and peptisase S24 domain
MSRIDRLQLLLERYADGEQTKLALLIGKSRQQISHWFTGYRPIGEQVARDIELALKLPRGWLDDEVDPPEQVTSRLKTADLDEIVVDQYDTGGSMGRGVILRDQPGVIKKMVFNREWLGKNLKHYSSESNLCLVTGFGDSMRGMFNPGDPLIVDKGVNSVEFDGVYYFRVGDEGFIKRLQRVPGEGLIAISENKAYRDWTINGNMDFEVFGRVLRAWHSEDY